jgi:hypothetical protein
MITPVHWPKLIDRTLFDIPFRAPDAFCSDSCTRVLARDAAARDPSTLTPCSRTQPASGIYLPQRARALSSHNQRALKPKTNTGYEWRATCRMDTRILNMRENTFRRSCTSSEQRNILFVGDSHGRFLYDALMPRLAGRGTPDWVRFFFFHLLYIYIFLCGKQSCEKFTAKGNVQDAHLRQDQGRIYVGPVFVRLARGPDRHFAI